MFLSAWMYDLRYDIFENFVMRNLIANFWNPINEFAAYNSTCHWKKIYCTDFVGMTLLMGDHTSEYQDIQDVLIIWNILWAHCLFSILFHIRFKSFDIYKILNRALVYYTYCKLMLGAMYVLNHCIYKDKGSTKTVHHNLFWDYALLTASTQWRVWKLNNSVNNKFYTQEGFEHTLQISLRDFPWSR